MSIHVSKGIHMKHGPWNINVSDGWSHMIHYKKTDVSLGQGHMILQTFQGYLYILSKSVWKVRDYKDCKDLFVSLLPRLTLSYIITVKKNACLIDGERIAI